MSTTISAAAENAIVNAVTGLINAGAGAGVLKIYTGAQPAGPDTAASGTLLATVALADPAFGAASGGSASATDPAPVTGSAAGAAGWFRVEDSNGNGVYDGAVTATGGGGELELSTTTISVGVTVDITSLTLSV